MRKQSFSDSLPLPERAGSPATAYKEAVTEARSLLKNAAKYLHNTIQDEGLMTETPLEVQGAMEVAVESIGLAIQRLDVTGGKPSPSPSTGGPTHRQGQFLAFIREYMMRNEAGLAPTHADLQRFFHLSPPSVNSMLIRLEKRGFIRRIPGKARAIEITLPDDSIPPLDQRFTL